MRRLVPAVGAALVLGSLVLLALLVVADDERRPSPSGQASGRDEAAPTPIVEDTARRLLERAAAAPGAASYAGTEFVAAWSSDGATSQVLQVSHTPDGGTTWRTAGHATSGGAALQSASNSADPSIVGGGAVALLSSYYSLATQGTAQVAGRTVDVVAARRPGAATGQPPVARFWLDRASGLVLRREVYDGRGEPMRASAFIDITVRETTPSGAAATASADRAWASTLDGTAVRQMRTHGWECPDALPGPLPLVDARRGGAGRGIMHLSYADGISSISVFQQRGSLDATKLRGYRREGVKGVEGAVVWVRAEIPRRIVWSADGTVYTVVADAPERTVDQAVVVLHEGAGGGAGGPMDRLGRGLDRVGSWFNPFE